MTADLDDVRAAPLAGGMRRARGGVLIIGGGFAGAWTARLTGEPGATLVSTENAMLFTPMLPEAASGSLEFRGIADLNGVRLTGWPGWMAASAVHWIQIPGPSRRMRVLADWMIGAMFRRDIVAFSALGTLRPQAGAAAGEASVYAVSIPASTGIAASEPTVGTAEQASTDRKDPR
jgi:hypothetical protein